MMALLLCAAPALLLSPAAVKALFMAPAAARMAPAMQFHHAVDTRRHVQPLLDRGGSQSHVTNSRHGLNAYSTFSGQIAATKATPITQEDIQRLQQDVAEVEGLLQQLVEARHAEEAAFKEQVARDDMTGDRYDAMLAAHHQQRLDHATEYNAAGAQRELRMRKVELATALFAAEQEALARQASEEAAELRLQAERKAREEAARDANQIRQQFLAL